MTTMTDAERALLLKLSELERYRLGAANLRLTGREAARELEQLEWMVKRDAVTGTASDGTDETD